MLEPVSMEVDPRELEMVTVAGNADEGEMLLSNCAICELAIILQQ